MKNPIERKQFGLTGSILVGLIICLVVNIILMSISYFNGTQGVAPATLYDEYTAVSEEQMYSDVRDGKITSAKVDGDKIMYVADGEWYVADKDNSVLSTLELQGVDVAVPEVKETNWALIVLTVVVLMTFGTIWGVIFSIGKASKKATQIMEQQNNDMMKAFSKQGKDGQNFVRAVKSSVRFSDVQGIDGIRAECEQAVDCLKNSTDYIEIGAKPKRGLLLTGAPGTGKTLLAKAIAGEAGVPFLYVSGSDFVEKYVGVGASRVRELYGIARKNAPCIVFIDEIDAIGGQRGNDTNSERDQTINALLTEMDGMADSCGILTIAATNRADMLDSALTRPGRFDLTLTVNLPDKKGRLAILRHHSKNKRLGMDVELEKVAARTVGFSGAALEGLMNEAAHVAVSKHRKYICSEDIDDAFFKQIMNGAKKPLDKANEDFVKTNEIIAWHEAGHALASKLLTDDSVPAVTIVGSTSGAGGVTFMAPKEGVLRSRKYLINRIKVSYAGRAAEQVLLGDDDMITTGASADIRSATNGIRGYLRDYGFGKNGMLAMDGFKDTDADLVPEASEMATRLYSETYQLLESHQDLLRKIAERLIEKETIDEEELDAIIKGVSENPVSEVVA